MGKKAKKKSGQTASGKYRVQVPWYDDQWKRRVKSFTAPTMDEARLAAAKWKAGNDNTDRKPRIRVVEAVEKYIELKRPVLSPATIRSYAGILGAHIENADIGKMYVHELNTTAVQLWISGIAISASPKTVRNVYGLLCSAVEMFEPDKRLRATLPPKVKPDLYCPSDDDIRKLLSVVRETYGEASDLEIVIMLGAFGTLRRGEICALESGDIEGDRIHVHRCIVRNEYGRWELKAPKTYESDRYVELPHFVIELMAGRKGRIIKQTPDNITHIFAKAVKKSGLKHFRLHDLRHYSASIMHAIGVPDQYIMARGGWASDNIMKSVYRNVIDIESVRQTKKINEHFENMAK